MGKFLPLMCYFLLVIASTLAAPQPFKALVAPINNGLNSPFLTITFNQNEKFVIDIESPFSWRHCGKGSFPHVSCQTSQCLAAQSNYKPPFCNLPTQKCSSRDTNCVTLLWNPINRTCASSQLTYTSVTTNSTDGYSPTSKVGYKKVYMSCAPKTLFKGLPKGSSGIVGLAKGPLSLAAQFSTSKVPNKFSLCLDGGGMAFFGEGPFYLTYGPGGLSSLSDFLNYVPLLNRPNDPPGILHRPQGGAFRSMDKKGLNSQLNKW